VKSPRADQGVYGGHQYYFPVVGGIEFIFVGFDVRQQKCHGLFHYTGRFDHLRKEHFSGTKQVANHVHPIHQRTFDDIQNRRI